MPHFRILGIVFRGFLMSSEQLVTRSVCVSRDGWIIAAYQSKSHQRGGMGRGSFKRLPTFIHQHKCGYRFQHIAWSKMNKWCDLLLVHHWKDNTYWIIQLQNMFRSHAKACLEQNIRKTAKHSRTFGWNSEFWDLEGCSDGSCSDRMHFVDLGKRFQTSLWSLQSASLPHEIRPSRNRDPPTNFCCGDA